MGKLVSVIIPIYNISELIERCVHSVMEQSYQNLEIILVDDGSTDDSGTICDLLSQKDDRIKAFHKINGGLSDARNYGIDHCTGEYISFIDGDDYILPEYIEKLYYALEENDVDFSQCQFVYAYDDHMQSLNVQQLPMQVFAKKEMVQSFLECGGIGVSVAAWGKLYRRSLFREIRYPKGRLHEDMFTTCDIVMRGAESAVVISEELYCYYQRTGSISKTFSLNRIHDSLDSQLYIHQQITNAYPELKPLSEYMLYAVLANIINENLEHLVACKDHIVQKMQRTIRMISLKHLSERINPKLVKHVFLMKCSIGLYLTIRSRKR